LKSVTRPFGVTSRVRGWRRFGTASREAAARGELVGQRPGDQFRNRMGLLPDTARAHALSSIIAARRRACALQVEMADSGGARRRVDRSAPATRGPRPERVHLRLAVKCPVGDHDPLALRGDSLRRCPVQRRRARPRRRRALRIDGEGRLVREPGNAERPQRILDERLLRQHPQPSRMQVPHPAERIDVVTARCAYAIVLIVRSRLARSVSIECSARRSRSTCCVRSRATVRQPPNPVQRIKRPNHSASPSRW
jgi:hypothetical protein